MTRLGASARLTRGIAGFAALLLSVSSSSADTFQIDVVNNCATPVWVRGQGNGNPLENVALSAKGGASAKTTYTVALPFSSGNIFGCWTDKANSIAVGDTWDLEKYCGMAEMSINAGKAGPNIDISFVDILTMSMRIEITGADHCNAGGSAVLSSECFQKTNKFALADAQKSCPTTTEGDTVGCWGAVKYCDPDPNAAPGGKPDSDFCKQLDAVVKGCGSVDPGCKPSADDLKHPTYAVYGCRGFFSTEAGRTYCGEINRGTFGNKAAAYTKAPFNTYAQHVHAVAGNIYAFPYDDVGNQSGDVGAAKGDGMKITYCPDN